MNVNSIVIALDYIFEILKVKIYLRLNLEVFNKIIDLKVSETFPFGVQCVCRMKTVFLHCEEYVKQDLFFNNWQQVAVVPIRKIHF